MKNTPTPPQPSAEKKATGQTPRKILEEMIRKRLEELRAEDPGYLAQEAKRLAQEEENRS